MSNYRASLSVSADQLEVENRLFYAQYWAKSKKLAERLDWKMYQMVIL